MRYKWLMVATLAFTGCPEEKSPTVPVNPYFDPVNPASVIANLQIALERMDLAAYEAALAPSFVFQSIELDNPPIERAEVVASVSNMFSEALEVRSRLAYEKPVRSDLPDYPAEAGFMKVVVPSEYLEVQTIRDIGAGPITFVVVGQRSVFVVVETSETHWQIAYQVSEDGNCRQPCEDSSWFELLTLFADSPLNP